MKSLFERISLPLKAIILGLLCGLMVWAVLDFIWTERLQTILTKQLTDRLQEEAAGNRVIFDRFIKQHARAVKLLARHQALVHWLEQLNINEETFDLRHYQKERPAWFPAISTWRGLIDPRHVLLRDNQGRVREIYHIRGGNLPVAVYSDPLLAILSQNQTYLTRLDGSPYLLASAPVVNLQNQRLGELVLIAQLDDQFLIKMHYNVSERAPILTLLDGPEGRILASNSPARLSAGSVLKNLQPNYVMTGNPFFDYGASDLLLQLATFVPKAQVTTLNEQVIALGRRHHMIAAIVFIATFTALIFLLSRRINQLILRITSFAQQSLGSKQIFPTWGDQLSFLDSRINLLMKEILEARENLRQHYRAQQKARQFRVLEEVTKELGVGILYQGNQGDEGIVNQKMLEFEMEYGKGWYSQDKICQFGDVELQNKRGERHVLKISCLSLFGTRDVILARDVTAIRRSQKILAESEERFRNITQSANDAIISIDSAGNIISWNDKASRMFGYSKSEVLESPLSRLIPTQYRRAHKAGINRIRAGHSSRVTHKTLELEGLRKDGSFFPLELSVSTWTMGGVRYFTGILRDVTRRIQTEKENREKQQLLEHIIENVPHSIFWKDRNSVYLGCNRSFARAAGLRDVKNIFGKTDNDLAWKNEEADFYRQIDKNIMESGEAQLMIEESQRQADGTKATLLTSKVPLRDANGEIIGILGIYADITERKRAEEILRRSEERFRDLTHSTADWIWEVDCEGKYTYASDRVYALLGYRPEELLGKTPFELMSPEEADRVRAKFARIAAARSPIKDLENWNLTKDGRPICLLTNGVPVFDTEDKLQGYRGVDKDITERKRAEEALRRERDFAESLIETAQAIVLVLDLKGRIVRFNPYMEQLSGYRLEELQGKDWFRTFLPEQDRSRTKKLFLRAVSDFQTRGNVNTIITRAGRERYIEWYDKTLKDSSGNPIGLLAIGHDITQHREQEAQLLQTQKLKIIGQLTDGIIHDFNNLLTIIIGNLQFLEEDIRVTCHEEIQELIDDALSAAKDGVELSKRLLTFSHKQPVQSTSVDIVQLLNDMAQVIRRTLGEHITLRINTDKDVSTVLADPTRVKNALLNLAINARDAMLEGGTLTVDTKRKRIALHEISEYSLVTAGTYIMITVADTGIGMTPEDTARAVEPFFTTKATGKGSGLGLSMVYDFAKQSGGGLRITSKLGMGTSVSILLTEPALNIERGAKQESQKDLPQGSETILVVEDGARLRRIAKRNLISLGYNVLEAEDADEAMRIMSTTSSVDLLFSDVIMPGSKNGYELAIWATAHQFGLKVLLTTGFSKMPNGERSMNTGNFTVLKKSYTKQQLAGAVRAVLDNKTN